MSMSYNVHNYTTGSRLYASQLNEMDKGIEESYRAMYSELNAEYTAIDFEVTNGSFRLLDSSFTSNWANVKMSSKFPVTAGETIYVTATGWNYSDTVKVAGVQFFSGNTTYTQYISYDLLPISGQKAYTKVPVVVPTGAHYAAVQGALSGALGCYRAHSAEDDLITIDITMTSGSFWHKDGRIQTWASGTMSNLFPVSAGENLYVTAKPYGGIGSIPGICWFTGSEVIAANAMGYDLYPETDEQVQYTGQVVTVPDGVTYALIQGVSGGTYGVKRQDLAVVWSNTYKLTQKMASLKPIAANLSISGTIYAVAGDTIQLFYESFIDSDVDWSSLSIKFQCDKGKNYPRYWEYTPTVSEVGTYAITIELYNLSGDILDSAEVVLKVVEATNPASTKNVLFVGDSLMQGQIPIETSRRFKGTPGSATAPEALSLANINIVGRIRNSNQTVGWEGTGGWRYDSYTTSGDPAVRFTVTGATNVINGDRYSVGGYSLTVAEVNVTNGSGNIRCMLNSASSMSGVDQSGTLTKTSGNGQSTISFTAWSNESYQPFWDSENDCFDITTYVNNYCDGQLDIICILLGINGVSGLDAYADPSSVLDDAKKLFTLIHEQLPDTKILASTLPMPSPFGGLGENNSASAFNGMYNYHAYAHKEKVYNKMLLALNDDSDFNTYLTIVNVHTQFDAEHGYPTGTKAINTRVSTTETVQTNGVHPSDPGYWQLADVLGFRSILGILSES